MTQGALLFAFDNEQIEYVRMAAWSARNIRNYLNIPVAVVTDSHDNLLLQQFDCVIRGEPAAGGNRWFDDLGTAVTWYNATRAQAYDLSPWDQTLLLDSDYVVNSSVLASLFDTKNEILCYRDSLDMARPDTAFLPTFGKFAMPMWWATVIYFTKTARAKWVFESMKMVQSNWNHYRDLYGISEDLYRNDYALSIALALLSGHTGVVDAIPLPMMSILPQDKLSLHMQDQQQIWTTEYQNIEGKPKTMGFTGMDFHAMGKKYLVEAIKHAQ